MKFFIKNVLIIMILFVSTMNLFSQKIDYFGQKPPGKMPIVFAPGIISTENREFYISFSDDGNLCLFISVSPDNKVDKMKYFLRENGNWGKVQQVPYYNLEMRDSYYILDAVGKTIYFSSKRPLPGTSEKSQLKKMWKMDFSNNQWQQPQFVDFQKDTDYGVGHPSFTKDGTVYFYSDARGTNLDHADIFFSRFSNGKFGKVQGLGSGVNTNANECDPFVDPNEKFVMIATSNHPDCMGDDFDLFISFRKNDGSWTKAINMGKTVNSEAREIYPRVTPDGKYIMFGSNRSGNWDIYWMDAEIIEDLKPAELKHNTSYVLAYSSNISGNPEIYLTDINGKEKLQLTDYELRDGYAACSPDGKQMAFYAYYDEGKTWSIHTMNIDGTNRKRLTSKQYYFDSSPSWSPDGKQIVFSRADSNWKKNELWIMDANGANLRKLNIPAGLNPSFAPDGRILYSTDWKNSGEICIANIDGSNVVQLTRNDYVDGHPQPSPDGKKVVFYSERDGNKEVYTMNIDGTEQKRMTNDEGADWSVSWSPDGDQIAFISNRDGDYDIYIINSDGSGLRNLTNNDFIDLGPNWLNKVD